MPILCYAVLYLFVRQCFSVSLIYQQKNDINSLICVINEDDPAISLNFTFNTDVHTEFLTKAKLDTNQQWDLVDSINSPNYLGPVYDYRWENFTNIVDEVVKVPNAISFSAQLGSSLHIFVNDSLVYTVLITDKSLLSNETSCALENDKNQWMHFEITFKRKNLLIRSASTSQTCFHKLSNILETVKLNGSHNLKIHKYNYLWTNSTSNELSYEYYSNDPDLECVSFFTAMCSNCYLVVRINNNTRNIKTSKDKWTKSKLCHNETGTVHLVIQTETNNGKNENIFWAIDDLSFTGKNGLRILNYSYSEKDEVPTCTYIIDYEHSPCIENIEDYCESACTVCCYSNSNCSNFIRVSRLSTPNTMQKSSEISTEAHTEQILIWSTEIAVTVATTKLTIGTTTQGIKTITETTKGATFDPNYLYFLLLIPILGLIGGGIFYYFYKKTRDRHKYQAPVSQNRTWPSPDWLFKEPDFDENVEEAKSS